MDNLEQIKIGSKAAQSVVCSKCQKEVPAGQFFSYKDKKKQDVYFCSSCRENIAQTYSQEMADPNLIQAALVGGLGSVIAGFLWFWIVELTKMQMGYFAIGAGFLIGYSVHWGSGMKRGPSLQMLSAILTMVTLYTSNYFIVFQSIKKYYEAHPPIWLAGGELTYISPFSPEVIKFIISPMTLLIWGIGIYFAYKIPKHRSI